MIRLAGAALKQLAQRNAVDPHYRRRRSSPGPDAPGPASGRANIGYAPTPGDTADPGEIVWTWVPFEDDPSRGKDRPVLIIGTEGSDLLGLMLTSRDRNNRLSRDSAYIDIGSGAWDGHGRDSEVYLERLLRIDPGKVRRIGGVLERALFDRVLAGLEGRTGA